LPDFASFSRFPVFFIAKPREHPTIRADMKHFVTATAIVAIAFALSSCCCM